MYHQYVTQSKTVELAIIKSFFNSILDIHNISIYIPFWVLWAYFKTRLAVILIMNPIDQLIRRALARCNYKNKHWDQKRSEKAVLQFFYNKKCNKNRCFALKTSNTEQYGSVRYRLFSETTAQLDGIKVINIHY